MRRTWLNTITAALCVAGAAATTAVGGPTDWIPWKGSSEPTTAASAPPPVSQTVVGKPSESISPYKHPIKYLASLSGRSNDKATAKPKADSLSLSNPTGPATPQLKIAMAQMCERNGDIAGARQHYQEVLKKTPGQVDVLRAAARMEDRLNQLQLAEMLYQQAVTANPQNAGAHNDLGMCLARQGKLDASRQEIEQAVRMDPSSQRYRNNAAVVLVEMRQDQRALAHLSAVHEPADANYNLGQLLVQRGRSADAVPYFSTALELNPSMQPAYEALVKQGAVASEPPSVATEQPAAAGNPVAGPQPTTPVDSQQATPTGPQMSFPATARNPAWGTSSYVPPRNYAPPGQLPQQATPRVSQAPPRYLPPVPPGPQQQQQPVSAVRR